MNEIRFLIDENTAHAIADQLLRRQPALTVLNVGDDAAPPRGTLDPNILIWLEENSYFLVTRNRRSMPRHLRDHLVAGHHVPGIFALRPYASMKQIIEDLILIWEASLPEEYLDQITYIPL